MLAEARHVTMAKRGEHADDRIERRPRCRPMRRRCRGAVPHRRRGRPRRARHRFSHGRISGPGGVGRRGHVAEAGYGQVDRSRVDRGDVLVSQAQPVHDPRAHVLGDDVGLLRQAEERCVSIGVFQVQHDARLVEVVARERASCRRPVRQRNDRPSSTRTFSAWRLHLDDVGPHHRQQLGSERQRLHMLGGQHAEPGQRLAPLPALAEVGLVQLHASPSVRRAIS